MTRVGSAQGKPALALAKLVLTNTHNNYIGIDGWSGLLP